MDAPSLKAFKARLDRQPNLVGGNPAYSRGLELGDLKVPSYPNHSMTYSLILWPANDNTQG